MLWVGRHWCNLSHMKQGGFSARNTVIFSACHPYIFLHSVFFYLLLLKGDCQFHTSLLYISGEQIQYLKFVALRQLIHSHCLINVVIFCVGVGKWRAPASALRYTQITRVFQTRLYKPHFLTLSTSLRVWRRYGREREKPGEDIPANNFGHSDNACGRSAQLVSLAWSMTMWCCGQCAA